MRQNRQILHSSDPGQAAYNRRSSPLFYPQQLDRGRNNNGASSSSDNVTTTDFDRDGGVRPLKTLANLANFQDLRQQATRDSQESSSPSQYIPQMVSDKREMIRKRKAAFADEYQFTQNSQTSESLSKEKLILSDIYTNFRQSYGWNCKLRRITADVDENGRINVARKILTKKFSD